MFAVGDALVGILAAGYRGLVMIGVAVACFFGAAVFPFVVGLAIVSVSVAISVAAPNVLAHMMWKMYLTDEQETGEIETDDVVAVAETAGKQLSRLRQHVSGN